MSVSTNLQKSPTLEGCSEEVAPLQYHQHLEEYVCFEPTTSEIKRVTTRMDCRLFIAETWIFVAIYCIKPGKRVLFVAKAAEIQDFYQVCLVCDSDCCELKMESPA